MYSMPCLTTSIEASNAVIKSKPIIISVIKINATKTVVNKSLWDVFALKTKHIAKFDKKNSIYEYGVSLKHNKETHSIEKLNIENKIILVSDEGLPRKIFKKR